MYVCIYKSLYVYAVYVYAALYIKYIYISSI